MLTPCADPGCIVLVERGRCEEHDRKAKAPGRRAQAQERRDRGDPSMTAYSHPLWRQRRRQQLKRSPDCATCGKPATVADHHPHTRRSLTDAGVADPDALEFLQSLCVSCHNRKTALVDGGFGR